MKFERNSMVWGCGDLMIAIGLMMIGGAVGDGPGVLVAFLLFVTIKFIANAKFNPWRCKECGTK